MRFRDRTEAGKKLAEALVKYKGKEGVVYPLPRGGIVLGVEIAKALDMPLDLIIPRKIGHPYQPEYAICAVSENGELVCNEREVARIDHAWLQQEIERQQLEARQRRERYLGGRSPLPVAGKTAILVDDGIATGLTMHAAIREAKRLKPAHIVVAVPVTPRDTFKALRHEVDDVVALDVPEYYLGAVGAYYEEFDQVSDAEATRLLKMAAAA